jgi:MFS family permease
MNYLSELRANWRPLVAAALGLGCGLSATSYATSIVAPSIMEEFGWPRSEFALINIVTLLSALSIPIAGRLADTLGVRRTALIGVISLPLTFLVLSWMTGPIWQFFALIAVQAVLCVTTTTTVYTRVVVEHFRKTRGLALAIVASGPALTGAVGGPLLNEFVEGSGWRAGYHAMGLFAALGGGLALLLIGAQRAHQPRAGRRADHLTHRSAREDYAEILRNRAFWLLIGAMILCNLPQPIVLSQLKLVLLDSGATVTQISYMLSVFSIGVLVGRFACGLSLDRFPAPLVGAISLSLPGAGLLILASGLDAPVALALAVFLVGLAYGAEGDLVGYLVVRSFGLTVYSSVLGVMTGAMALSIAIGSTLLSITLAMTGSFDLYLIIAAVAVVAGALLLLLLPRPAQAEEESDRENPAPVEHEAAPAKAG